MDDPTAEERDYACSAGTCVVFAVTNTNDCDGQDGYYGGGDTAGCGDDPSAQQRDYYVDTDGTCTFSTANCGSNDCDVQDVCVTTACDGNNVMQYQDFYVEVPSGNCISAFGALVENCTTKASTDTDGGPADYNNAGTVTDYTVCAAGVCSSNTYPDTCNVNILDEYGASGAGYVGPAAFDCESNESDYCSGGDAYRDEWNCTGAPGYCSDAADILIGACGIDGCLGGCPGCQYHLRGCNLGACFDNAQDPDLDSAYCTGCLQSWNIGGDISATVCCGDDAGENDTTCQDNSANGDCGADTQACCANAAACVDHTGTCVAPNTCPVFGAGGKVSFCSLNTWYDPDDSAPYCSGCSFTYLPDAAAPNMCCGDDSGEDLEQTTGAGANCCYNASLLFSGSSSGSILCYNGDLYDCNATAGDDSDLAEHKVACEQVGSLYCTGSNTWAATQDNGCSCTVAGECSSNHCAADYDAVGSWCADTNDCAHDAVIYSNGSDAPDCDTAQNKWTCSSGSWSSVSCGVDTTCTDYQCSSGTCNPFYAGTGVQCNAAYACGSGVGDGAYGNALGEFRCQGYCDGAGTCDYADNCEDCNALDGWENYGDVGPGCTQMDDPTAEEHDYSCSAGNCTSVITNTADCDSSDGYYQGGDTPGCGADADSYERDYYVNMSGNCGFGTTNCDPSFNCDGSDTCGNVCNGTSVFQYQDYYVVLDTATCASTWGPLVEDCMATASTDSDGGPADYTTAGTVTDYDDCAGGSCTASTYSDNCNANMVNEYGASGAGYVGPVAYNCENYETIYCFNNDEYRDEWTCSGGACNNSAPDTIELDCGVNQCSGACPGCTWDLKGCALDACYNNPRDPDEDFSYCSNCGGMWAIGGETAPVTCCGDDVGEFATLCNDSSANGDCTGDTTSCCTPSTDCVDFNGACQADGTCGDMEASGIMSYCNAGVWEDPDEASAYCTAAGCAYTWTWSPAMAGNTCCGDDSAEYVRNCGPTGNCPVGSATLCCDQSTDCADDGDSTCANDGECHSSGNNSCNSGSWTSPTCGDGVCCGTEDQCVCQVDCCGTCGDGCCGAAEDWSSCAADCPLAGCGDATCDGGSGETATTCPMDCPAVCPDGCCTHNETSGSCPADCS
jgi:hypothetical protein